LPPDVRFQGQNAPNLISAGAPPEDSAGGAYSAPPDYLAGLRSPTCKGREEREGKEGRGKGKEEGKREVTLTRHAHCQTRPESRTKFKNKSQ